MDDAGQEQHPGATDIDTQGGDLNVNQVEQPAEGEGEQQSGDAAEITKTDGGVTDGGGTGSNDGKPEDHPDHESNQVQDEDAEGQGTE